MVLWYRTPAVARTAVPLLALLGCNEVGHAPPASQADALAAKALLLMLDEAVREVQTEQTRQADLSKPEREPDVIYVPTPEPVVDRMLEMAQVDEDDVVYDLGCGDGRIVVRAAELYGAKAWGFDIDPERVAEARANVEEAGVEDLVTIEQADIFTLDLSPATVVTLYLLPELNVRLIPQLNELSPGSRIVSHDFGIEGIVPLEHAALEVEGEPEPHEIFLWHAPLEVPGAVEDGALSTEGGSPGAGEDKGDAADTGEPGHGDANDEASTPEDDQEPETGESDKAGEREPKQELRSIE